MTAPRDVGAFRARWIAALGGFPERTPLDARVVEVAECGSYRRETIRFWSEPDEPVSAYLLIPHELRAPAPAVLCIHQHAGEYDIGKSEVAGLIGNPDIAYARHLAERGFIAIAPDMKGFETRRDSVLVGQTYELFLTTQGIVRGDTLQRRHLWDLVRTLDYLVSRPEVDTARIGCIGHSLGGQETFFLMATDERVRAGVVNCGVGTVQSFFDQHVSHNAAWYVPGFLDLGDTPAFVDLIAPRPLTIIAGERDRIFPRFGVRQIIAAAEACYAAAGQPDAFSSTLFDGGHSFPPGNREIAYIWLERWLRAQPGITLREVSRDSCPRRNPRGRNRVVQHRSP
jgi:dienelactone hydrolase